MNGYIKQIFDMLRVISGCAHPGSKERVGQSLDQPLPQGVIEFIIRKRGEFVYRVFLY